MKVIKTLKELLKEHGIVTRSGYDRYGEVEYLYIPNSHGSFFDNEEEKFDRYAFVLRQNKVMVRKDNIGVFQSRFVPWKGEDPSEMYFNFVDF